MGDERPERRYCAPSAIYPRRGAGDEGASLVEFALLLPLLMALLLGMFTGGIAYNRKISMTSAVREGARFGATLVCNASCLATSPTTWSSEVTQRVVDVSGGELTAGSVCVWLGTAAGTVNCGLGDPSGSTGSLVVKVSATRTAKLEYIFGTQNLTLKSSTANRYERTSTYGK